MSSLCCLRKPIFNRRSADKVWHFHTPAGSTPAPAFVSTLCVTRSGSKCPCLLRTFHLPPTWRLGKRAFKLSAVSSHSPPLFCQFRITDFSSSKSTSVVTWGGTPHTVVDSDNLSNNNNVVIVVWKYWRRNQPRSPGSRVFRLCCNLVYMHAKLVWGTASGKSQITYGSYLSENCLNIVWYLVWIGLITLTGVCSGHGHSINSGILCDFCQLHWLFTGVDLPLPDHLQ